MRVCAWVRASVCASSGVARGGGHGGHGPPKLLVVNFPINLRCYVILGCRVINVLLAINIGDSAFFDIAALVRQFGGLRHHQQTESIHWPPKPKSWLRHCVRVSVRVRMLMCVRRPIHNTKMILHRKGWFQNIPIIYLSAAPFIWLERRSRH